MASTTYEYFVDVGKPVTKRHQFVGIAELVCFREAAKTCADHFRDVPK